MPISLINTKTYTLYFKHSCPVFNVYTNVRLSRGIIRPMAIYCRQFVWYFTTFWH